MCGRTGEAEDDDYDYEYEQQHHHGRADPSEYPSDTFSWTPALQQEFREELERLVILGTTSRILLVRILTACYAI